MSRENREKVYNIGMGAVGGTILGMLTALTFAWSFATKAANEVVAPITQELTTHLATVAAEKPHMLRIASKVEVLAPEVQAMRQDIRAICRALPKANCTAEWPEGK